jgi:hypothetical protein
MLAAIGRFIRLPRDISVVSGVSIVLKCDVLTMFTGSKHHNNEDL